MTFTRQTRPTRPASQITQEQYDKYAEELANAQAQSDSITDALVSYLRTVPLIDRDYVYGQCTTLNQLRRTIRDREMWMQSEIKT